MRLAVVVPRYGSHVLGGAETLARRFAEAAVRRGWTVEVWTTCAHSHYTWENVYPAGSATCHGVVVRRFPITLWDPARRGDLEVRLATRGMLHSSEAYAWLDSGPHSPALYAHVARHAADFDAVIALPYALPLIHYAAWAAPDRTVLWPCLHDEPYAYLEPVRLLLENVRGLIFNAPEEAHLALHRLKIRPRRWAVLGAGATLSSEVAKGEYQRFEPFVLYVGRLEEGKNVLLLYAYMRRYFEAGGKVRLVVAGDGPVRPPRHPAFVTLGFVAETEKVALYRSALALCQPSVRESFSLTIMEAWLAGRPVLVHEDCPVTQGHVRRSQGGLWFGTEEEFAGVVEWLLAHPDLAKRLGENGRRYVLANYTWERILDRFQALAHGWGSG